MDNFINLAKQGYQAYEASQGSQNHSGDGGNMQDQQYHEPQAVPEFNHDEVIQQANQQAGDSNHHSFFSSAMSHITGQHSEHTQPIDEDHVTHAHKQAYEHNNASSLDATSMGAAAAMQALKMYTSGNSGSSGSSSQLMSLAMSEASKLFDSSGGAASGGKQQVINGAAMTMMKLVVQSKFSGGGGSTGTILNIANKLL